MSWRVASTGLNSLVAPARGRSGLSRNVCRSAGANTAAAAVSRVFCFAASCAAACGRAVSGLLFAFAAVLTFVGVACGRYSSKRLGTRVSNLSSV
ncbi:MAG: hypothetical protein COX62_06830, partial [Deltaproteobacteria bacterium CG_4_10_14_0_2_um_filter_43_8]